MVVTWRLRWTSRSETVAMSTWQCREALGDRRLLAEAVVALLALARPPPPRAPRALRSPLGDALGERDRGAGGPSRSARAIALTRALDASRPRCRASVSCCSRRPTSSRSESCSPVSAASFCAELERVLLRGGERLLGLGDERLGLADARPSTADGLVGELVDAPLAREHARGVVDVRCRR